MRAKAALAIALFGLVVSPIVGSVAGSLAGVAFAAILAAVGIALFPER